jgi:hypothetical protein|mmetsp:Transcript_57500/g.95221  ORF Transcript_57500/g.95221 Transcript_57500/m.95221 type:complete len:84 (+) Transcript_57500:432-683(+)
MKLKLELQGSTEASIHSKMQHMTLCTLIQSGTTERFELKEKNMPDGVSELPRKKPQRCAVSLRSKLFLNIASLAPSAILHPNP